MSNHTLEQLRTTRLAIILSLLAILFGFGMGGVFGGMEDQLKAGIQARAQAVKDTAYQGDEKKLKETTDKAWAYYKRAHMHGGAIGTATLAAAILLALGQRTPRLLRSLTATGMSLGGLGYSIFWLWAGMRAPGMGSTSAAKESLQWLAAPTALLCILGLVVTTFILAVELYSRPRAAAQA